MTTGGERVGRWEDTAAVVVAYAPDLARLAEHLAIVRAQCAVVLVDNSERPEVGRALAGLAERLGAQHISMNGNAGIAAAQNAGIAWALEAGARYVLLLDDDSRPDPQLVDRLRAADTALRNAGEPVAAVGARARTRAGADISNARAEPGATTVARDMMSSGSLVRADVLRQVGLMEDRLFIDCVDFEWGWRARAKGLRLFLANDAWIEHTLGMGRISVLGLRFGIPSPIRHYYQYRNVLWMLGRDYVPASWKLKQVVALAAKVAVFSTLVEHRLQRLRYMTQGVRDAVRGKGGRHAG